MEYSIGSCMRAVAAAVAIVGIAATAACRGSTAPSADFYGSYTLTAVNGGTVPYTSASGFKIFAGGFTVLNASLATSSMLFQSPAQGAPATLHDSLAVSGLGSALALTSIRINGDRVPVGQVVVSGATLTVHWSTGTADSVCTYTRQ